MTVFEFLEGVRPISNKWPKIQVRQNNRIKATSSNRTYLAGLFGPYKIKKWYLPRAAYGDIIIEIEAPNATEDVTQCHPRRV